MTMERHGSERYAHGDEHPSTGATTSGTTSGEPAGGEPADGQPGSGTGGESARAVRLVADRYLVTVNPVDGSEIEPCPPGEQRGTPAKLAPQDRPVPETATAVAALPPGSLLERDEERERLTRLLSRGRSVRLTGRSGSGRSALLDAVAADVASLAPDGVIRLSGYHRTPSDLMYDLFAAVHSAPLHRPGKTELVSALGGIGAVVLVDDLEFGGEALDELLRATPECAFVFAVTPDQPAPAPGSYLEEVFLPGLSRTACMELMERAVHRQLTDEEADWAADLWFGSEGLPLRFVQAGALLRLQGSDSVVPDLPDDVALAPLLAAALSEAGRGALRLALALDGELPDPEHLPALTGDPQADESVTELLASGLISPAGGHFKLAAGVAAQLTETGHTEGGAAHALAAAQHYSWWAGQASVSADRVAQEADALLAAVRGARRGGSASAAVLLARTAAPVLAAGMRWSAWERVLRCGQEAARASGELAEEAYFHHELGILALSAGNPERARSELETALGLRGTLAEQRGMVAGRRALALVTDQLAAAGAAGPAAAGSTPPGGPAASPAVNPYAPVDTPPLGAPEAATAAVESDAATTPALSTAAAQQQPGETLVSPTDGAPDSADTASRAGHTSGRHGAPRGWRAFTSSKRNLAAAGAGALIAAVLGTVVTLGTVSDDDPPDSVRPDAGTSQDDEDNAPGDASPGDGSRSGQPGRQQPAAGSPSQGVPQGPASSSQDAGTPGGRPSSSEESSSSADDPSSPHRPPSSPDDPPSSPNRPPSSSPEDPPSSQDPSPDPSDDTSSPDPGKTPSGGADRTPTDAGTTTGGSPSTGQGSDSAAPSAS
ncbi:ATP-binding protein [Streptomyces sp. RK75]|uniref:ATP-binding protein n=1 Tax=Streptomyces sp. RK75 TaxID=2824895 RepID=UPI001B37776B|nr:ATP-binding protein [Streptomyces sp. RK75]MBQ0865176.1 ATP-binding protein [Streptomyces sp. RK75]